MSLDFSKLVAQGRAKAMGVCWSPEELEALIVLEKERKLSRLTAADYIRNGVLTPEAYDAAQEAKFAPKTLETAEAEMHDALKENGAKFGAKGKPKKK